MGDGLGHVVESAETKVTHLAGLAAFGEEFFAAPFSDAGGKGRRSQYDVRAGREGGERTRPGSHRLLHNLGTLRC